MAYFKVEGLDDLAKDFENISTLPSEVIDEMLNAEADVVVAAQKRTAKSMLSGPYAHSPVLIASSIKKSKVKKNSDGASIQIQFVGSRKRAGSTSTKAEIAFVNEFGKRGQNPRPFIETANEECADDAVQAALNVYDAHLKTKNL